MIQIVEDGASRGHSISDHTEALKVFVIHERKMVEHWTEERNRVEGQLRAARNRLESYLDQLRERGELL